MKDFLPIPKPKKEPKPKTKTTRTVKTRKTVGSTTKKDKHTKSWYRNKALELAQRLAKYRESFGGPTADQRYCFCISCGKRLSLTGTTGRAEGGHYVSRMCRATEIDLDNIHPQCHTCNCLYGGNEVNYRINLVKKIGTERVERLEHLLSASNGDEEALSKLNERDQLEVLRTKGVSYYKEKIEFFKEEIKKEEQKWR